MDEDLDIQIHKVGSIPVVVLSGDIDAYTCSNLRETIVGLLSEDECSLVISMANVNYVDSCGLGTLVGGLRRVKERNGVLAICGANPQIERVFKITGLGKMFSLFDDEEQAVRSLGDPKLSAS